MQAAADSIVQIGSGAGAINVQQSTNLVDGIIDGVTLELQSEDATKEIVVSVQQDSEVTKEAVQEFVDTFNDLMTFIDEQTQFIPEANVAGTLIGNRTVNTIQQQLRNTISRVIPNLPTSANRLSAIGIKFDESGKLRIEDGTLDRILAGNDPDISVEDVRRLFSLDGQSSDGNISFILGSSNTQASENPYDVFITRAAERASITTTSALGATTDITSSNKTFQLSVDGVQSETLTLTEGTYTAEELASHVQDVINQSNDLQGQVTVTADSGLLTFTSNRYGDVSQVGGLTGDFATNVLSIASTVTDDGVDVAGYFSVDGETETATGNGRVLTGDFDNENTSGIQLNVTLAPSQITGTYQSELTVTRGFASQIFEQIESLTDTDSGRIAAADEAFQDQIESIDVSIDRLNAIFEERRQKLVADFVAVETQLSSLQNTSSALIGQLSNVSPISL